MTNDQKETLKIFDALAKEFLEKAYKEVYPGVNVPVARVFQGKNSIRIEWDE